MITGIPAANRNIERPHALTAPIRSLPFIPSDFSATVSPAGTIVEMQAVVTIRTQADAAAQAQTQQPKLEVLA
jgi:hypothetical protein